MKIIVRILITILGLLKAVIKLLGHSLMITGYMFEKTDSIKTIIPYIYQVLVIVFDIIILSFFESINPIKDFRDNFRDACPPIITWILWGLLVVFLSLFLNACIEFSVRIIVRDKADELFISICNRQKHFYNYSMSIIAILAIYAALDKTRAEEINQTIMAVAILIVACMLVTDIYFSLMSKNGFVKKTVEEFIDDIK